MWRLTRWKCQRDIMMYFAFYNKGLAEAKNINITINSDPEDYITLNIQKDYLPYPKLLPQQNFDIAYWSNSDKPHQTIVITWDDEYGKGRSKEMIIDI
jgi:hypothetical protein